MSEVPLYSKRDPLAQAVNQHNLTCRVWGVCGGGAARAPLLLGGRRPYHRHETLDLKPRYPKPETLKREHPAGIQSSSPLGRCASLSILNPKSLTLNPNSTKTAGDCDCVRDAGIFVSEMYECVSVSV